MWEEEEEGRRQLAGAGSSMMRGGGSLHKALGGMGRWGSQDQWDRAPQDILYGNKPKA